MVYTPPRSKIGEQSPKALSLKFTTHMHKKSSRNQEALLFLLDSFFFQSTSCLIF